MIAVVVVAGLFALPNWGVVLVGLSLPCLALLGAPWLVLRGHRRLATFGFWTLATMANVLYAAACVAPDVYLLGPLFVGWVFMVVPTIGSLGTAWATLATRTDAMPRRPAAAAWLSVVGLSLMPLMTLWTLWPLHLAFLSARPALERLADQVAAGQAPGLPRWVGVLRVAGSAVDPITGNVGLMIDPNPNGPTGFVRVSPGTPPECRFAPIRGDDLEVDLGGGWWYHEED